MNDYNDEYRKKDSSSAAIGLLGVAAGAAIGIAVAGILTDPQKRKRVEKQFQDLQKWGNRTLTDLRNNSYDVDHQIKDGVEDFQEKSERVQKELDEAMSRAQQK